MATAGTPKTFLKNYNLSTQIYLKLLSAKKKDLKKGSSNLIDKILLEACIAIFEQHVDCSQSCSTGTRPSEL